MRPHAPRRPLVCFDAINKEQHRNVVEPLPVEEGQAARVENTYEPSAATAYQPDQGIGVGSGWRYRERDAAPGDRRHR